ncbi:hypothetical protein [Desulfobacter vibrioformis]|uniref:hypothetical protein n=1 Tax=Desulfobacter vibrioformis TaxID=34031 RepID=UPI00054F5B7C|nr:hypothetical protein [Desulfobacter vibrioformis]
MKLTLYPMLKSQTRRFRCLVMIMLLMAAFGCSSKVPTIKFKVTSEKITNEGQPVYLLIRTLKGSEFVTDDYDTIAALVHASPTDDSIVSTEFIIPGRTRKLTVSKPDDKDLGVYCLFTKPDAQWKLLLQKPLKKKYVIRLENNAIRFD